MEIKRDAYLQQLIERKDNGSSLSANPEDLPGGFLAAVAAKLLTDA